MIFGPTWEPEGQFGSALSFDGVNDYVEVPDDATLDLSAELTIAAWVNPSQLGGYRIIVGKSDRGTPVNYYLALLGDELDFGFFSGNWIESTTSGVNLVVGTWYHVAVAFDDAANTVRFYVDGIERLVAELHGTPAVNALPLRVGSSGFSNEFFSGLIDEVQVFNRALNAEEILNLRASTTNAAQSFSDVTGVTNWQFYK